MCKEGILILAVCPLGIICVILLLPFIIMLIPVITTLYAFNFLTSTFGAPMGFLLFSALVFVVGHVLYRLFVFIREKRQGLCSAREDKIFNEYILRR